MKNRSLFIILVFLVGTTALVSCEESKIQPTEEYYAVIKAEVNPGFPFQIEQDSLSYTSSIVKLGTSGIKSYGICYGLNANPTLKDMVVLSTKKIDTIPFTYTVKVKNLKSLTPYQVRSFVVTATDTVYSVNNFMRTYGKNEWANRVTVPVPSFSQYTFNNNMFDKVGC